MAYIGDLSAYINSAAGAVNTAKSTGSTSDIYGLDMNDFLQLMVAELTNQSIDSTADTSEMINQMVQMQMVQALVNMTDASVMSYAASLVGKEVTIGVYDAEGNIQELVGTVTATGSYGGEQVVFVDGTQYYLSEIIAVGNLVDSTHGAGQYGSTGETGLPESGAPGMVDPGEASTSISAEELNNWANMTAENIDTAVSELTEHEISMLLAAITGADSKVDWSSLTDEQTESMEYLIYALTGTYPQG